MMPVPTLYLRFVERLEIDYENSSHEHIAQRPIRVLQQFWEHPGGSHAAGDMFHLRTGTWRDVPVEREA
jgi:hypothetical protein